MNQHKGLLIALEGIDGSGKSSLLPLITDQLRKLGVDVHPTSEPTKREVGKMCRKYLSDPSSIPTVDALLFAADRIEHYFEEIMPKIESGVSVITDRYKYSSMVYQGSSGVQIDWIKIINDNVPDPDLTIFIDISTNEAIRRVYSASRDHLEKFETESKLQNIKNIYEELEMNNRVTVNGEQSKEELAKEISRIIFKELQ